MEAEEFITGNELDDRVTNLEIFKMVMQLFISKATNGSSEFCQEFRKVWQEAENEVAAQYNGIMEVMKNEDFLDGFEDF